MTKRPLIGGGIRARVRRLFRLPLRTPEVARTDANDELDSFLAERIEQLIQRGLTAAEARDEALRRLGGTLDEVRAVLQRSAEQREGRMKWRDRVEDWIDDLRYAARGLARRPGFSIAAVLCLAIGIGANTTMFGVVDTLLLRPPAGVRDPGNLLWISSFSTDLGMSGYHGVQYPDYLDFSRSPSIAGAAAYSRGNRSFGSGPDVRQVSTLAITSTFMPLLGARPVLGRFFTANHDRADGPAEVIVGFAFWRGQLGGAADVVGKTVRVRTRPYTVIGVAPRDFNGIERTRVDLYLPLGAGASPDPGEVGERNPANLSRTGFWFDVLARPRPHVDRAALAQELDVAFHRSDAGWRIRTIAQVVVFPLATSSAKNGTYDDLQNADVSVWLAGVAFIVLVIACANVAGLLLTQAVQRRREIAVRLSLGIGRGRLVRLLLTESVMLAGVGGALGLLLAFAGGGVLRRWLLSDGAVGTSVLDPRVLAVTLIATIVTGVICGLAPALQMTRPDLATALRAGTQEGTERRGLVLGSLLVGQVALTTLLVVGAGLFVRSLHNLATIELGFDANRVLLALGDFKVIGYSPARTEQFFAQLLDRVRGLPGVERAALGTAWSFVSMEAAPVIIPDRPPEQEEGLPPVLGAVTPDFFATLGISLRKGRGFTAADRAGTERVTVVNDAMARHFWPAGQALGKCLKIRVAAAPCTTVVGIMTTTARLAYPFDPLGNGPPIRAYYVPLAQRDSATRSAPILFVRTAGEASGLVATVRRTMQTMAPELPYAYVKAFSTELEPRFRPWQLGVTMFGVFGAIAVGLAILGLYGVLAFRVSQRAREIGVRMALGADRANVRRLVLGQGLRLGVLGVTIGLGAALAAGHFVAASLYRVSARDPVVLTTTAGALLVIAMLASYLPALRATRIDPMEAVRDQ